MRSAYHGICLIGTFRPRGWPRRLGTDGAYLLESMSHALPALNRSRCATPSLVRLQKGGTRPPRPTFQTCFDTCGLGDGPVDGHWEPRVDHGLS